MLKIVRLSLIISLLMLIAITSASAQEAPSQGQRIALTAKPAVVRIYAVYQAKFQISNKTFTEAIGGTGSGFFINPNGFIATNAHVVEPIHNGDEKARIELISMAIKRVGDAVVGDYRKLTDQQFNIIRESLRLVEMKKRNDVLLTNGESVPFEIKSYGAPVGEGKDCAIIKIEVKNAPTLKIGDSEKVQLQDHIYAIGYPGAADLGALLDDKSKLEASITDGAVSAKKNTADGSPVLQVTTPIAPGNSGGAAINEAGEAIGLPTFKSANAEGFNFIVTSTTLNQFVKEARVENVSGLTDKCYREGLELYWQRYYTEAIEKFQEVQSLFPAHSEVKNLIAQARDLKRQGKERSRFPLVLVLVLAGVAFFLVLIVGGGAAYFFYSRSRAAATASATTGNISSANSTPLPITEKFSAPISQSERSLSTPSTDPLSNRPTNQPANQPVNQPVNQAGANNQPVRTAAAGSMPPPTPAPVTPAPITPAPASAQSSPGSRYDPAAATLIVPPTPQAVPIAEATVPIAVMNFGTLTCTKGLLKGQRFQIPAQGVYAGRGSSCQVVIPDGRASTKHVWIGLQNGRMVAIDQNSTNGTFINSLQQGRITQLELKEGDTVIVSEPDVCCLTFSNKLI